MQSPFGEAKPRELIIATREGKSEEDILRDEVKKEKLHVSIIYENSLINMCMILRDAKVCLSSLNS